MQRLRIAQQKSLAWHRRWMLQLCLLLLIFLLTTPSSADVADNATLDRPRGGDTASMRGVAAWWKRILGIGSTRVLPTNASVAEVLSETKPNTDADTTDTHDRECIAPTEPGGDGMCVAAKEDRPSSSVYVIGDIHGDAICAVSWVNRTGLISNLLNDAFRPTSAAPIYEQLNDPSKWIWMNDDASLVFMGDYVDKGPTAKQTVEFVRDLTITFPDKVTALLGNHELELLRDRDSRISPVERYSAYTYATVHPGDYHNYVTGTRDLDESDEVVLDQLYLATMEVYAHRAHAAVRVIPSLPNDHIKDQSRIQYAITDIVPPEHRRLVVERLAEYQDAYLNTFRSGSPLGSWLETRPIVYLAAGIKTLFLHGGVSHDIGSTYFSKGEEGVETINSQWWANSHEDRLLDFLRGTDTGEDSMGGVVYELLTYRGNHPGYGQWESHGTYNEEAVTDDMDEVCQTLHSMLDKMEGIDRIAVGHTPEDEIRITCEGKFLALDSTLGRWIRGTGNEYCPGPEHFINRKGVDVPTTSRDGKYTCDAIKEVCEGQIVRLDADGSVNILTMV